MSNIEIRIGDSLWVNTDTSEGGTAFNRGWRPSRTIGSDSEIRLARRLLSPDGGALCGLRWRLVRDGVAVG